MAKIVDKQERAAHLVRAATRIFAEKGFAATRMEDIAKKADVSKGLLYEYYRSKEALFMEVCNHLAARGPLKALDGRSIDESPRALIGQVAANYDWSADFFLVLIDWWGKVLRGTKSERRKYLKHVDAFYAERRREIGQVLASLKASGKVRKELNTDALASLVIACVEGIHMQDFLCSQGTNKDEALETFAELILGTRALHAAGADGPAPSSTARIAPRNSA